MSVPVIAFFNNQGGVGTTLLVYHLAWMFSDLQVKVLAVDLDPQAALTEAFLGSRTEFLHDFTVYECIQQVLREPDSLDSLGYTIDANLVLLPSDLFLSVLEDELALQWQRALGPDERAFRTLAAPWRVMKILAQACDAQLILADLGPNLSAINRAGLIAADHIVFPMALDLFSVQGMKSLGSTLRKWRAEWQARLGHGRSVRADLPNGEMPLTGYVIRGLRVAVPDTGNRVNSIPECYGQYISGKSPATGENLGVLQPYTSLSSLAQDAGKPMFHLKPADGAIGAFLQSAEDARKDFEALAKAIVAKAKLPITFA